MPQTPSFPRPCAIRARAAALVAAAGCLLPAAASAAEPQSILLAGSGLTAPSAVAQDPGGGIWVADHVMGLCKVSPATGLSPGSLIEGPSCNIDPTQRLVGPVEAVGVVFDEAESAFYVGGAGADGGIWKLGYNPGPMNASGTISVDSGKTYQILNLASPAGEIVFGMGFDPNPPGGTPVLDFTTKRTNSVYRLVDPGNCPNILTDPATCSGSGRFGIIATASITGGGPVAHLNGFVYLGEDIGVTRFESPANLAVGAKIATKIPASPSTPVSSLAIDPAVDGGRIYFGTTGINPTDSVIAIGAGGTAAPVTYVSQLAGVSALGLGNNGTLLIGDDPGLVSGAEGVGRLASLERTSLLVPETTLTSAPPAATSAAVVSVGYSSRAGVAFECRLDPPAGNVGAGWEPCGSGPAGVRDYPGLAEGPHRIEVRAVDSGNDPAVGVIGPGPRTGVAFLVDRTAPVARIDNPASDHSAPSGTLVMRLASDDATAAFECSLDTQPWAACSTGHTLSGLTGADYLFKARAVDGAGNVGPVATWDFVVDPSKRPRVRTSRLARIPARGPITARARIVGRRLVVRIPAPAGSRVARITIERKGTLRTNGVPGRPTVLERRVFTLRPGRVNVVSWAPSADRLGRVVNLQSLRVMVRVGASHRRIGPARAAIFTTSARFWRLAPSTRPTLSGKEASS